MSASNEARPAAGDAAASDHAMPAPRRIGLLGGSFDPPHLAHLALGRAARQTLALDELRWLPAGAPWQKLGRPMAAADDRVAMLRLLIAGEPGSLIERAEIDRDGPTYTIDTVRQLQQQGPAGAEWFLIIGQDQYGRFDTWRDWRELLERVTLAVAARGGMPPAPPPALAGQPHRVRVLPLPRIDISASSARARVRDGKPIADLVGPDVAGYIARKHLYTEQASS